MLIISALPVIASAAQAETGCSRHGTQYRGDRTIKEKGTCQEPGIVEYECDYPGFFGIGRCNRTWQNVEFTVTCHTTEVAAKEATCAEPGNTAGITCSDCGQDKTKCAYCAEHLAEVIPTSEEHTLETLPAVPATCTATGLTEGKHCTVCGTVTVQQTVVEKAEHTSVAIEDSDPTCSLPGTTGGTKCSVCGEVLTEPTTTPATNQHVYETFVETKVAATCIQKGIAIYKCNTCELTQAQETDFSSTHNWKYVRPQKDSPLNCTTPGVGVYECEDCKATSAQETSKLGHALEVKEVVYEATCTDRSVTTYVCNRVGCGFSPTIVGEPNGHTEETIPGKDATCAETGLTDGTKCSVCGEVLEKQVAIPTLDHNWGEKKPDLEPTCTEDGYTAYRECQDCPAIDGKTVIPKKGHTYVNHKCKDCESRDPDCSHTNRTVINQAATCSATGIESFTCHDCGDAYEKVLPKLAHTEVDQSVAATCTQKGKTHKVCSVCGEDTVGPVEIPTIAHSYVNGFCSVCGVNSKPNCSHPWYRRSTERVNSTCTEHGYEIVTCTECRAVVSENYELPLASHRYVNGFCSACSGVQPNRFTFDFQDVFIVG